MPFTPREAAAAVANWEMHEDDGQVVSVRENGKKRVQTVNKSDSLTVQSDREQAEMKSILAKYEMTGVIEHLRQVDLEFRDITAFDNYHDAMREAERAKQEFMTLPSKVREVFDHDHGKWLDAAEDGVTPEQHAKLVKLGMVEEITPVEPEAPAAPVSPPAPPAE